MTIISIKTIIFYSFSAITLIGLVTNSLTIFIFSRKNLRNVSFSIYFRFFVLFQFLNLILPINRMLEVNLDISLKNVSDFFCKSRFFYALVNYSIAAWFLVIISIDQFMNISFSKKFTFRNKIKFQLFLSILIIIFNLCFYSPIWIYFSIQTQVELIKNETTNQSRIIQRQCKIPNVWFQLLNLFQSVVIPFILMATFTMLSIRTVFKSRCKAKTAKSSKDIRFAITSIVNILIFFLMNLPMKLYVLIDDFTSFFNNLDTNIHILVETMCHMFLYSNLITPFFISYFVNSIFKKEFNILFPKRLYCTKNLVISENSSLSQSANSINNN
jgi:hypothetical protein